MGTQTLVQMRAEVKDLLEQNDRVTDASLNTFINQAHKHIARPTVFDHPQLQRTQNINLVAAQSVYSLDTRVITIMHDDGIFIVYPDGRKIRLRRLSYSRLQEDSNLITGSEGTPSRYARRGNNIHLNVFPASELTTGGFILVPHRARPLVLAADGDVTEIDDIFDQVITHLAAAFGWARLGQQQRSDFYRDFALSMLNDYGDTLDLDATDPTDGFEVDDGNTSSSYVETY